MFENIIINLKFHNYTFYLLTKFAIIFHKQTTIWNKKYAKFHNFAL